MQNEKRFTLKEHIISLLTFVLISGGWVGQSEFAHDANQENHTQTWTTPYNARAPRFVLEVEHIFFSYLYKLKSGWLVQSEFVDDANEKENLYKKYGPPLGILEPLFCIKFGSHIPCRSGSTVPQTAGSVPISLNNTVQ